MKLNHAVFLGITMLTVASCRSGMPGTPPVTETFTPLISDGNIKEFDYEIALQGRPAGARQSGVRNSGGQLPGAGGGPGGGGGRGRGPGSGTDPMSEIDVDAIVTSALAELEFCREGFDEIERIEGRGRVIYRGRCREPATEADRNKYESVTTRTVPAA